MRRKRLYAGVISGRNVWRADRHVTLEYLNELAAVCPDLVVSTGTTLLHVPYDVLSEYDIDGNVADRLAFGAYQALQDLGLLVPSDVSIVSFDDDEIAAYLRPGLTTIALPHEAMGRVAVELLLDGTKGKAHLVPMPIVRRGSHSVLSPLTKILISRAAPGPNPSRPDRIRAVSERRPLPPGNVRR